MNDCRLRALEDELENVFLPKLQDATYEINDSIFRYMITEAFSGYSCRDHMKGIAKLWDIYFAYRTEKARNLLG